MQHISPFISKSNQNHGGGRIASGRYRQSLALCDNFTGLEDSTNRYDLLLLVKRVGKDAGFTPRMIQLLDYYTAFTTQIDWEEGNRPIVYQSLSKTAMDLGVTERQIQNLEKQLFEAGAITWNDSGNHKRYGSRDPETGRILFAYGVDLTPLAYLRAELEDKLHQKQLTTKAWQETKRQISATRRQIRSLLLEWREEGCDSYQVQSFEQRYDDIAVQLRTHIDLADMRSLLERHQSLYTALLEAIGVGATEVKQFTQRANMQEKTQKHSCTGEEGFAHNKYTNPIKNNICSPQGKGFQKSVAESSRPEDLITQTGLQHISLKQVLMTCSERFREHLPLEQRPITWSDVTEAAYSLRSQLQISQKSWAEACDLLGRAGAAVCVLLTDRAMQRPETPVLQPAAYFYGMINKARSGHLKLHNSIFGLLGA